MRRCAARSPLRAEVHETATIPVVAELYPSAEPYRTGMLDVGDGNLVYWETCGNPAGKPALVVHGGPGSGCTPGQRRRFDPARYRVVLFGQRTSGEHRCAGAAPPPPGGRALAAVGRIVGVHAAARLRAALPAAGVGDRHHRRDDHPALRDRLALPGAAPVLPRGVGAVPRRSGRAAAPDGGDPIAAFGQLMADPDPRVRAQAADDWSAWEDATISLDPAGHPGAYSDRPHELLLARARLCAHFFSHTAPSWRRANCSPTLTASPASRQC